MCGYYFSRDAPDFYYGFVGVAILWQIAFLAIGRDPIRLRPMFSRSPLR